MLGGRGSANLQFWGRRSTWRPAMKHSQRSWACRSPWDSHFTNGCLRRYKLSSWRTPIFRSEGRPSRLFTLSDGSTSTRIHKQTESRRERQMAWNYQNSLERIKQHVETLQDIEVEKLVREADLEGLLSETRCRQIYGAHTYVAVSNFSKLC